MPRDPRHYDQQYFDRWYRDPRHRVFTAAERARRVAVVLSVAEYVLGRRVRSVLDVGAGEGHWRAPLIEARPRIEYVGLDPSPYVVERFGQRSADVTQAAGLSEGGNFGAEEENS